MEHIKKHKCPCCGYYTFNLKPPGTFDICPVCYWEDDNVQYYDPNYLGGANRINLKEAQENFKSFGVMSPEYASRVRPPREDEK